MPLARPSVAKAAVQTESKSIKVIIFFIVGYSSIFVGFSFYKRDDRMIVPYKVSYCYGR